jgi:V8-like Glu-specific endopeptidase
VLVRDVTGGQDGRQDVPDANAWPWRAICAIEVVSPSSVRKGTGWFVGPNTVITAAHVLTGHLGAIPSANALTLTVRPGRQGEESPWGAWPSKKWAVSQAWRSTRDPGADLGAIFLSGNPGASVGSLAVRLWSEEASSVAVAGYPLAGGGGRQLQHRDSVHHTDPTRLYYGVDTTEGQSGGPVLLGDPAEGVVIGIHAYGFEGLPEPLRGNHWNSGVRVTASILSQLLAWRS